MDKEIPDLFSQTGRKQLRMRLSAILFASGFVFSGTGESINLQMDRTSYLMTDKPAPAAVEQIDMGFYDYFTADPYNLFEELEDTDTTGKTSGLSQASSDSEAQLSDEQLVALNNIFRLFESTIETITSLDDDTGTANDKSAAKTTGNKAENKTTQETNIVPPNTTAPATTQAAPETTTTVEEETAIQEPLTEREQVAYEGPKSYPLSVATVSQKKIPADILFDENAIPLSYTKVIEGRATAYTATGNRTATGTWPTPGTIAVNPKIIPYGTKLWIVSSDGQYVYGYAVAEDTGGFIYWKNGPIVDLYMNSNSECYRFGTRSVKMYVLS